MFRQVVPYDADKMILERLRAQDVQYDQIETTPKRL
jgi:hypothetical protein